MMRQFVAILILPINAILVVPSVIYLLSQRVEPLRIIPAPLHLFSKVIGGLFVVVGFVLAVLTIIDFIRIGRGTLAPWDPPQKLVVRGIYRYVRNPMISGVTCILLGEALILNHLFHLGWAVVFAVGNGIYLPLFEEPGLERRFGQAYNLYRQHVPRWLPRLEPWRFPDKL